MKKILLSVLACALASQLGFAQQPDHVDGQRFLKQITYNTHGGKYVYNRNIKDDLDKLLFGWTNSMVEYVYDPSFEDVLALSVAQDTLNGNYTMKVMRVSGCNKKLLDIKYGLNEMVLPYSIAADSMLTFYEFSKLTAEKYTFRNADGIMDDILRNMMSHHNEKPPFSAEIPADSLMSFADFRNAVEYRNSHIRFGNFSEKLYRQYRPIPTTIVVSEAFALKLHYKISTLIRDFKAVRDEEIDPFLYTGMPDGESATFRCVVGDELWSLYIHRPQRRALRLSNILNQLVEELVGSDREIDEAKYSKLLDEID